MKTSTLTSENQPPSSPTPEEIARDGIALPPECGEWRYYPLVTPDRAIKAVGAFQGSFTDQVTWLSMLNRLYAGTYFEHPKGCLIVDEIRPGLSGALHIGSFDGHGDPTQDEPTKALFRYIMAEGKLRSLNATVLVTNRASSIGVRRIGGELVGLLPNSDSINGEPVDRLIFTFRSA